MSGDKTTIQTTAGRHAAVGRAAIDTALAYYANKLDRPLSDIERQTFAVAAYEVWELCTAAVLREGNCQFERGE